MAGNDDTKLAATEATAAL
jgi:hypothetical protein